MPAKVAMVVYDRCRPAECNQGSCKAASACTRKLLKQESAYEPPMSHPSLCKACGDCVRACPSQAIRIVTV